VSTLSDWVAREDEIESFLTPAASRALRVGVIHD
jgi:hypothetical protein